MHNLGNILVSGFECVIPAAKRQLITRVHILPAHKLDERPPPYPGNFNALWDTGATSSTISTSLAEKLGLPIVSSREMRGASGSYISNGYLAALRLPNNVTISAHVFYGFAGADNFDMLIGMDVIASGDFLLCTHNGTMHFSFQMPSTGPKSLKPVPNEAVKDVPVDEKITRAVVGRRQGCPCGSGKKFKNCCEKKVNPSK